MSRALSVAPRFRLPSNYYDYLGYAAVHLGCLGVIWVGISWRAAAICLVSYLVRMFGLIAGYHRYFAHRGYKTSRPVQFLMALLGALAVQKGVLWWAETHRHHHRFPDEPDDLHSPLHRSFLYSHSGWFLDEKNRDTHLSKVPDLAVYPELVWLDKWNLIPVLALAASTFAAFGWTGLIWGFFVSTILIWHSIHAVGSFGHKLGGYRRYPTADNSRNHWIIALLTLGEWHNNHHYFPPAARQGFFWYELDVAYYLLKAMSWLGLVWDLKTLPEHAKHGELLPGYQRRIQAFKAKLMDLRRQLNAQIDRAIEVGDGEAELSHRVTRYKELIAQHIDAFEEAAYTLLVRGPLEMTEAFFKTRDEIVAEGHERLSADLGRRKLAELAERLGSEFDQLAHKPEFLGKLAA